MPDNERHTSETFTELELPDGGLIELERLPEVVREGIAIMGQGKAEEALAEEKPEKIAKLIEIAFKGADCEATVPVETYQYFLSVRRKREITLVGGSDPREASRSFEISVLKMMTRFFPGLFQGVVDCRKNNDNTHLQFCLNEIKRALRGHELLDETMVEVIMNHLDGAVSLALSEDDIDKIDTGVLTFIDSVFGRSDRTSDGSKKRKVEEAKRYLVRIGVNIRSLADIMLGKDREDRQAAERQLAVELKRLSIEISEEQKKALFRLLPDICKDRSYKPTGETPSIGGKEEMTGGNNDKDKITERDIFSKHFSGLIDRIFKHDHEDILTLFFCSISDSKSLKIGSDEWRHSKAGLVGRLIDAFREDNSFVQGIGNIIDDFMKYLIENEKNLRDRLKIEPREGDQD